MGGRAAPSRPSQVSEPARLLGPVVPPHGEGWPFRPTEAPRPRRPQGSAQGSVPPAASLHFPPQAFGGTRSGRGRTWPSTRPEEAAAAPPPPAPFPARRSGSAASPASLRLADGTESVGTGRAGKTFREERKPPGRAPARGSHSNGVSAPSVAKGFYAL